MQPSMTKQRLERYKKLQKEIAAIEDRVAYLESRGEEYLSDVVSGSAAESPYGKHSVVIKGYGSRHIPQLRSRAVERRAECNAIEAYINSIDDSVTWQLLTRRYIDGKSLKETARLVGYSQNHACRLINDFLKKLISHDNT